MGFTTRPEIKGTFGVATSTHWTASAVGMKILEAGGGGCGCRRRDGIHASGGGTASERPAG